MPGQNCHMPSLFSYSVSEKKMLVCSKISMTLTLFWIEWNGILSEKISGGLKKLSINYNCIVLYGRWVPGMSTETSWPLDSRMLPWLAIPATQPQAPGVLIKSSVACILILHTVTNLLLSALSVRPGCCQSSSWYSLANLRLQSCIFH